MFRPTRSFCRTFLLYSRKIYVHLCGLGDGRQCLSTNSCGHKICRCRQMQMPHCPHLHISNGYFNLYSCPPVDIIWVVMIFWNIREQIIRVMSALLHTVLCATVSVSWDITHSRTFISHLPSCVRLVQQVSVGKYLGLLYINSVCISYVWQSLSSDFIFGSLEVFKVYF